MQYLQSFLHLFVSSVLNNGIWHPLWPVAWYIPGRFTCDDF